MPVKENHDKPPKNVLVFMFQMGDSPIIETPEGYVRKHAELLHVGEFVDMWGQQKKYYEEDLVNIVSNTANFEAPIMTDHSWSVYSIIGEALEISYNPAINSIVATMEFRDEVACDKVRKKLWKNLSVTIVTDPMRPNVHFIGEVSVVWLGADMNAKMYKFNGENQKNHDETEEENGMDEKMKEQFSSMQAQIEEDKKRFSSMQAEVDELKKEKEEMKQRLEEKEAKELINSYVMAGKTLPAQAEKEAKLYLMMDAEGRKEFQAYKQEAPVVVNLGAPSGEAKIDVNVSNKVKEHKDMINSFMGGGKK